MLKFMYRLAKHISILFLISLPLQLAGIFLLGLYLPIHKYKVRNYNTSIKLPYILRWFDNADLYVDRDVSTYLAVFGGKTLYLWYWLTIRNPCNYFGYEYLGVEVKTMEAIWSTGNAAKVGDDTGEGLLHQEIFINKDNYYEYYYVKKWSQTKCFRFRMGVKLSDKLIKKGLWLQGVFVIQPYKDYWGS